MTIDNADKILINIREMMLKDKNDAKIIVDAMNKMLDDLLSEDFFGTEGQLDPRGDWRDFDDGLE